MQQPDVAPGTIIAGRFRVIGALGKGGMGQVVEAEDRELDRRVAIKFLLDDDANTDNAIRLVREARVAARITSEHVVRILDIGRVPGGAPFVVMECLRGRSLAETLQMERRLGVADAVDYLLQALEAVAEGHALGIVHRDLKPSNLFVTERADGSRSIKVLDFGIAKVLRTDGDIVLTGPGEMLGSPAYMAPEQILEHGEIDERTDIWALGVVLFELTTGALPFSAAGARALAHRILTEPAPRACELVDEIPRELEAVVLRCLEKLQNRRFASAGELAEALLPFSGSPEARLAAKRAASFAPVRAVSVETVKQRAKVPGMSTRSAPSTPQSVPKQLLAGVSTTSASTRPSPTRAAGKAYPLLAAMLAALVVIAWWVGKNRLEQASSSRQAPGASVASAPATSPAPALSSVQIETPGSASPRDGQAPALAASERPLPRASAAHSAVASKLSSKSGAAGAPGKLPPAEQAGNRPPTTQVDPIGSRF